MTDMIFGSHRIIYMTPSSKQGLKRAVIIINVSAAGVESTFGETSFSVSQEDPGDRRGDGESGTEGICIFLQKFEKGFSNFLFLRIFF